MRRPSRLATAEQAAWIRFRWGASWEIRRSRPNLLAIGRIQPVDFAQTYTVQLVMPPGGPPDIRVLSPTLVCADGQDEIPHMYQRESLCLYFPPFNEWTLADRLADTIIPWTSEWLYFYEVWLVTGEWLGGGIHPGGRAS